MTSNDASAVSTLRASDRKPSFISAACDASMRGSRIGARHYHARPRADNHRFLAHQTFMARTQVCV
jgi:hypothetical protein